MPEARRSPLLAFLFLFLASSSFANTISEEWLELRMQGSKIGFAYQKIEETKTGYRLTSKTVMKLELEGTTQDISTSQTYFLDKNFRAKRFSYMQKMLNHRQYFDGVIKDGILTVKIKSGKSVTEKVIPYGDDIYLGDAINLVLGKKKLKTGDSYSYKVFIVPMLSQGKIDVSVGKRVKFKYRGKTERPFMVTSKFSTFSVTSYITPDGRLLKEESPMGFIATAVDKEKAVSFKEGVLPFTNLLAFSLISIENPIERQDRIKNLNLDITGLSGKDLIPADYRQTVLSSKKIKKGEYRTTLSTKKIKRSSIPKMERNKIGRNHAKDLKSTFEAQSSDPAIIRQAKKIVAGEKDAYKSAVMINRWVYRNVKKKYVDTFSAVETLRVLEGECQSHTNLFSALAKSQGIPTRTVSGIVYSPQFNGFLYHAWPEVYVGRWVAMDPTFGQEIADATHIKLIEGDLSAQLNLFEFVGKIGININSIKRK